MTDRQKLIDKGYKSSRDLVALAGLSGKFVLDCGHLVNFDHSLGNKGVVFYEHDGKKLTCCPACWSDWAFPLEVDGGTDVLPTNICDE